MAPTRTGPESPLRAPMATTPMPRQTPMRSKTIPTFRRKPGAPGRACSEKSLKLTRLSANGAPGCGSSPLLQNRGWSTASCAIEKASAAKQRILSNPALRRASTPALGNDAQHHTSGCRPGARPVEVCPSICAILNGQRGTRGRQRIAGPKSVSERQKARQFAACPEFSPDFLPFLPVSPCAPG